MKPILIVGAGPAGLAAAHALASVGQRSILVEKEQKLGGAPILSGYAKLVPSGEWAKDAIGGMVGRVEQNSLVSVHRNSRIAKFEGRFVWDPSKPDGQPRRAVDGSKARRLLGWSPRVGLEEGLSRTVEWYEDHRQ